MPTKLKRLAAFGIRSMPPDDGSAGADKFAMELYPRIAQKDISVTVYNRVYAKKNVYQDKFKGVQLVNLKTVKFNGFDTVIHSLKATYHIIRHNTADIVHIHNGGNSIWGIFLKLAGKRVYVSQDGVDWQREKWPWYAKIFLFISSYITAMVPDGVIFDNIFAKEYFEVKFNKSFQFIPYGSESTIVTNGMEIFHKLGIEPGSYFLFVGRFIPDKGIQYLVPAFERINTNKKLVLVGGAPNPSDFELKIKKTSDKRILFPGYIYGEEVLQLMKNAYTYIQPSDVEGLSPVILTIMGLGTPLLCSNIRENQYVVGDTALMFQKGNIDDLEDKLKYCLDNMDVINENAENAFERANTLFNWDKVTAQHLELFQTG